MRQREICRKFPTLSYRQLDHWTSKGWVIANGAGTGNPRDWPATEVVILERMINLVDAGVKPEIAAKCARGDEGIWKKLFSAVDACTLGPSTDVGRYNRVDTELCH
jgi:hypothetical protein